MTQLPPILYHYFSLPVPYTRALALQNKIYELQLAQRRSQSSSSSSPSHKDYLLLLQHRPVYTAGRRQTEALVQHERNRLTKLGADFVNTSRGGETTYHGPGQIVGYPLLDLSRSTPTLGIRDYICRLQKTIQTHLLERHGIRHVVSEHTGVFVGPTSKIASIGVQVRHRLTTHGFAYNVTNEPRKWFDQIVACGLVDVKAGSVADVLAKDVVVEEEIPHLVSTFGRRFEREMVQMDLLEEGEVGAEIMAVEQELQALKPWATAPAVSS